MFAITLQPKSVASHLRLYWEDASQFHDDIDSGTDCSISTGNLGNAGTSPGSRCNAKNTDAGVETNKDVGKEGAA